MPSGSVATGLRISSAGITAWLEAKAQARAQLLQVPGPNGQGRRCEWRRWGGRSRSAWTASDAPAPPPPRADQAPRIVILGAEAARRGRRLSPLVHTAGNPGSRVAAELSRREGGLGQSPSSGWSARVTGSLPSAQRTSPRNTRGRASQAGYRRPCPQSSGRSRSPSGKLSRAGGTESARQTPARCEGP